MIATAKWPCVFFLCTAVICDGETRSQNVSDRRSGMGRLAHETIQNRARAAVARVLSPESGEPGYCDNEFHVCIPDSPAALITATQAEVSIAVDSTGQHVVIGFNDFRGLAKNPVSASGVLYSDDGGNTFHDGGQLPSPGTDILDRDIYPQIFGDPDVKYLGGCNFIYSSLLVKTAFGGLAQTLGIHRSTDCGHTWTGPVEVTPATNPGGFLDINGNALDEADKESMDVDPDTGRVLVAWSNFTPIAPGGVEISATYTDNILSAAPVFAPRRVISAQDADGSGTSVRFAGNGSPNAYVAWTRFYDDTGRRIAAARSTDNGVTWSPPVETTPTFRSMDEVLGNDRVNEYPSVGVDESPGPYKGNVYLVYSNNNSGDGADVYFQRSTNGGLTFSAPIAVNSRPGGDRPQWFPYITVDKTTGRVIIFYYDQGIGTSGDLTEVSYLHSDDGGVTWSSPAPLSERPFHAGWGNDTSQPNLGDYNHAVAQRATLYAGYGGTRPQKFTDGQPSSHFETPDVFFRKVTPGTLTLPLRLGPVLFTDSGANNSLDPGDRGLFRIALVNNDSNPLHSRTVSAVTAILSSNTPGVSVTQASSAYPDVSAGMQSQNLTDFAISLSPSFVPGTPIELELAVTARDGTAVFRYTQPTGTLLNRTLLSENFDGVATGALPAGWLAVHGAGNIVVPWQTSRSFCGSSNKAFHVNADDGDPDRGSSRWERLLSPLVRIPADASLVEVEFDVCYDTEDDPRFRYRAYDGLFLRVTDLTPGRVPRTVLAEAFDQDFTTGAISHYPKHLIRNPDRNYFEDMSVWAGNSGGMQHVRMTLPGMAGSEVRFAFEYTQDGFATCADVRPGHACGVSVDNFAVRSIVAAAGPSLNLQWSAQLTRTASEITAAITVRNEGPGAAENVQITSAVLGSTGSSTTPLPRLGAIPPGGSVQAIVRFPAGAAAPGTASILRLTGVYDGGTFGGSVRVSIPR